MMKIVQFKDGSYGVRRGWWPFYEFLVMGTWWPQWKSVAGAGCRNTHDAALTALNKIEKYRKYNRDRGRAVRCGPRGGGR